jgi:hypothetical protein
MAEPLVAKNPVRCRQMGFCSARQALPCSFKRQYVRLITHDLTRPDGAEDSVLIGRADGCAGPYRGHRRKCETFELRRQKPPQVEVDLSQPTRVDRRWLHEPVLLPPAADACWRTAVRPGSRQVKQQALEIGRT